MIPNIKLNSINEEKITESSLLYSLKKVRTSFRTTELLSLINKKKSEVPKLGTALKAIIILFPKEERYNALKILKDNFDIQLISSQIGGFKSCLLEDSAFNKLLPFTQKKFLESFLVQQNGNKSVSSKERKPYKANTNQLLNNQKNKNSKQNSKKSNSIPLIQNQAEKSSITKSKIYVSNIPKADKLQTFLKRFSRAKQNDQFNWFFQFQQSKSELITEYLAISQNIIELFRWIPEISLPLYFKLPIIALAIDKVFFSWDEIISMLKTFDNGGVYLFIEYLLAKNKLTETIDIEQLKMLLIGKDFEKRLDFFNLLKSKQLITSEINTGDMELAGLFPNLEDQLNNNIKLKPLFFRNKACKHILLPTIEEEYEKNTISQNLSRRI